MKVQVLYGRGVRSGGPEALHQLVDGLRAVDIEAHLVAHPQSSRRARLPAYEVYDAPEAPEIVDDPATLVIAPEIFVPELLHLRRAGAMCWWLSIDNSPVFRAERYLSDVRRGIADRPRPREARSLIWWVHRELFDWRKRLRAIHHLAQSEYASHYVASRLGVASMPVSDYVRAGTGSVDKRRQLPDARTAPVIAYNPAKGLRLVRRVMAHTGDLYDWVPIAGMTADEVQAALRCATVYLDLGAHPGKDRLPREAALAGAVAVVARRGSGAFDQDVPIAPEHKIAMDGDAIAATARVLRNVVASPGVARASQEAYRSHIRGERQRFEVEVGRLADQIRALPSDGR